MTKEEAKSNQDRISKHYSLEHWYGTRCRPCCGVYPKLVKKNNWFEKYDCAYECEVCGRRTGWNIMPWVAEEEWNNMDRQYTIFDFLEAEA